MEKWWLSEPRVNNASVHILTYENLKKILASCVLGENIKSSVHREEFDSQVHESTVVRYLFSYLNKLKVGYEVNSVSVVVETDYIDRDFIREYSGFYSSSFLPYEKRTTRLHFFAGELTQTKFNRILTKKNGQMDRKKLSSSYLGFIVVRPLPQNFIGKTCLEHRTSIETVDHAEEGKQFSTKNRSYPVWDKYEANLFGLALVVRSVAFQEKDTVVGMCATSALYSLFHGSHRLLGNSRPSGLEITKKATTSLPTVSGNLGSGSVVRAFPNTGLSLQQMTQVVSSLSLSPITFSAYTESTFLHKTLGAIYAYLGLGLPVLAYSNLITIGEKEHTNNQHVVTLNGYVSKADESQKSFPTAELALTSSCLVELCVHDDNVGPFTTYQVAIGNSVSRGIEYSALRLIPTNLSENKTNPEFPYGTTRTGKPACALELQAFIVAASENLRLDYEQIYRVALVLNTAINAILDLDKSEKTSDFVWDIKYVTVDTLRQGWSSLEIDQQTKLACLKMGLPKYSARLICKKRDAISLTTSSLFELVLDATATKAPSSMYLVLDHCFEGGKLLDKIGNILRDLLKKSDMNTALERNIAINLVDVLADTQVAL
jgi:hypothetical protein